MSRQDKARKNLGMTAARILMCGVNHGRPLTRVFPQPVKPWLHPESSIYN